MRLFKWVSLSVIFIFAGTFLFAQETGNDSYTIQRLIIYNEKGEILLQQHPNGWMTPALRHNTEVTTNRGLQDLASGFGLQITLPQLQGIFMYFHSDHKKPSFRQHYSARLEGGQLSIPEDLLDAQWFLPEVAVEKMLLPESKIVDVVGETTRQILYHPDTIWGGSFLLVKTDEKTRSEVMESYYPIGRIE